MFYLNQTFFENLRIKATSFSKVLQRICVKFVIKKNVEQLLRNYSIINHELFRNRDINFTGYILLYLKIIHFYRILKMKFLYLIQKNLTICNYVPISNKLCNDR